MPGRAYWQRGHRIYLEGAVKGKRRLFLPQERLCWRGGAASASKGAFAGEKVVFLHQKGASAGRKAPYNTFGAKIDPGLRYSSK